MKTLVTGGAGFIGSHLVRFLADRGDEVTVLDDLRRGNKLERDARSSTRLVRGDVRDAKLVEQLAEGCETVYHLAAVLGVDAVADNPLETMEVEVIGMRNVVEACTLHGIQKLVYASTSGVYGKRAMESAVTENIDPSPVSSYAIAKRFNEIYLIAAYQERGIHSVSVRLFNVYGPRQDERMVLPRFVSQALQGRPITVYGSGKQTRDFTFVGDTVRGMVELGDKVEGCEIFNVARGADISLGALADMVKDFFDSDSEILHVEPPPTRKEFEVDKRFGNSDKMYEMIGYRPTTDLQTGLFATYGELSARSRARAVV